MGNMSYCRFENTLGDLQDCFNALNDKGIKEIIMNASSYEEPCIRRLIEMCHDIAEEYPLEDVEQAYKEAAEELEEEEEEEES